MIINDFTFSESLVSLVISEEGENLVESKYEAFKNLWKISFLISAVMLAETLAIILLIITVIKTEISVTKKIICKAIRLWVSGKRYKECLVVGANRYDLAGNPVGKVTEKQIQFMKREGE